MRTSSRRTLSGWLWLRCKTKEWHMNAASRLSARPWRRSAVSTTVFLPQSWCWTNCLAGHYAYWTLVSALDSCRWWRAQSYSARNLEMIWKNIRAEWASNSTSSTGCISVFPGFLGAATTCDRIRSRTESDGMRTQICWIRSLITIGFTARSCGTWA